MNGLCGEWPSRPASPLAAPPLTMPMRRTTRTASSKLTASQRIQGEPLRIATDRYLRRRRRGRPDKIPVQHRSNTRARASVQVEQNCRICSKNVAASRSTQVSLLNGQRGCPDSGNSFGWRLSRGAEGQANRCCGGLRPFWNGSSVISCP